MKLSKRQRIAWEHTCRLPEQCEHPRFYWPLPVSGPELHAGLTLDSGYA